MNHICSNKKKGWKTKTKTNEERKKLDDTEKIEKKRKEKEKRNVWWGERKKKKDKQMENVVHIAQPKDILVSPKCALFSL